MKISDLATMLELREPWKLTALEVDHENKKVRLSVSCEATVWGDPESGQRLHIHSWEKRRWRHLDFWQYETVLEAEVPRLEDPSTGKTQLVEVPWASKNSRWTNAFEAYAVDWLQACSTIEQARKLLRLSWDSLQRIIKRAVERGLICRELEGLRYLGIDEKSFRRGQNYISVLVDLEERRVLEVVEGANKERACQLLNTLKEEQREGIEAVAMDRSETYISAVEQELPKAAIVHDRFHLSAELNKAMDSVRRQEQQWLLIDGEKALTGTKFLFGMVPHDMNDEQIDRFLRASRVAKKTARAWEIKELFAELWEQGTREAGEKWFEKWYRRTVRSRLPVMVKLAKSLKGCKERILTWFEHRISNAAAEGFNSIIQQLRAAARGFRNFEHYRYRILFYCGKLALRPR